MQAIVSFEAKNSAGSNPGDFEMFVDLCQSDTILMYPPVGYKLNGIKLYSVSNAEHRDNPSPQKAADITSLKGNASTEEYSAIFPSNTNWSEFNFTMSLAADGSSMTLTNGNPPGHAASYEFLVWLVKTADSSNDYADPGIRNRG